MMEVTYDGDCCLEVRGHAGTAPRGQDLICAGATVLVLTLGEQAEEKEIRRGYARITGGNREVYIAIAAGFQLLAKNFPEGVHFKCIQG